MKTSHKECYNLNEVLEWSDGDGISDYDLRTNFLK